MVECTLSGARGMFGDQQVVDAVVDSIRDSLC